MGGDDKQPFFPFGRQVGFAFKSGSRILFQCKTATDSWELSELLNKAVEAHLDGIDFGVSNNPSHHTESA